MENGNKRVEHIQTRLSEVTSSICPHLDPNGGGVCILAGTKKKIQRGDHIISCYAASIVLDPQYRHSRCAYCANICINDDMEKEDEENNRHVCESCYVVSFCQQCKNEGVKQWHDDSGECMTLSHLSSCHFDLFCHDNEGEGVIVDIDKTLSLDSSILLAIRIMFRRQYDDDTDSKKQQVGRKNENLNGRSDDEEKDDCKEQEKIQSKLSPFPNIKWSLLDHIYSANIVSQNEQGHYDAAINALLTNMKSRFDSDPSHNSDASWISKDNFDRVIGKIIGCGHAITDVTAQLGCQSIGRALFLEHSFYNHCCSPNAFLSCHIQRQSSGNDNGYPHTHQCALMARLHCIHDIDENSSVCISYIPTSGLDGKERRKKLRESYNFECTCDACKLRTPKLKQIEKLVQVPDGADVEAIRQMQFQCNQKLLEIQKRNNILDENATKYNNDEKSSSDNDHEYDLQTCLSTIVMNKRGIHNQSIPVSHEVSIESHRLHAAALSVSGDKNDALKEHEAFLESATQIQDIFDPVALATSILDYGLDLQKVGDYATRRKVLELAREHSSIALGEDHAFVEKISHEIEKMNDKIVEIRETKRQKL